MNKTHGSRKQDIEMLIKIEVLKGNIKRAIDICTKYNINSKKFGQLCKEVNLIKQ